MTCTISEEQLFSWIDRQAPDLEEHLATCPACRSKTDQLRGTIDQVTQATRQAAPSFPPRIGEYDIIRLLGSGGQGWVFEAQQASPRRRVALKVVKSGCIVDAGDARRIRREADMLGILKHSAIASVYEAGCSIQGEQYFAMELVAGEPLIQFARTRNLSIARRLDLFLQVCDAIDYAHQQGVIHRDLKPSNILVERDERPKILDFGLARLVHPDQDITATLHEPGKIMGTLQYMSPEHAGGDPGAISAASDVYALSVILYELLTEHPPYELDSRMPHQALRVICEQAPNRPSKFHRRIRGDLETILLTGLEKDPARRYASAAALAEDIRRYLRREPISARRPSTLYRLRKLVSRNKTTTALIAVIACMAAGFGAWVTATYVEARTAQERALEPTSNVQTAIWVAELAERNWADGKLQSAKTQCERALQGFKGQLPDSSRTILNTRILLGRAMSRTGGAKDAEPLLRKAMQAYAQIYPNEPGAIAEAKSALGECLTQLHTFREAEMLLTKSYPEIRDFRGANHRRTREARQAVADLYLAWGKPDKAREYGATVRLVQPPAKPAPRGN